MRVVELWLFMRPMVGRKADYRRRPVDEYGDGLNHGTGAGDGYGNGEEGGMNGNGQGDGRWRSVAHKPV